MPEDNTFMVLRNCLLAILTVLLLPACEAGEANPDSPVVLTPGLPFQEPPARHIGPTWPRSTPEAEGLDPQAVERLRTYLFSRQGDDENRLGIRTNAFVLIRNGKIVMEEYARGYGPESAMLTWSVSKSVTNALVGRTAYTRGLDINAPAYSCIPELDREPHRSIALRHLMQMSSGLGFNESYEASPVFSSVIAMLYTRGRKDMAAFTASHDLIHPAGSYWNYSSGDTNLMMRCLKEFYSEEEYANMPWTELFDPLQIQGAVWERDGAGTFVGSSYLYIRPTDLARIGYLFMHDGVWNGKRLLPEGWVRYSLTVIPAYHNRRSVSVSERADNPAAYWYRNVGNKALGIEKPWPEAPDDTFAALGHWGKGLWVIPSLDMIVVRLGDDRRYACRWPDQEGCEPDVETAYSKRHLLKLVTETVKQ